MTWCGARRRPPPRGGHRDHESAGDRTHARLRQRRDGRTRRQGHHRGTAQLSRQPLSRRADRHHGRRRQHRHARADPVRPRRNPLPSVSAEGNDGARIRRPCPRPRCLRPGVAGHVGHSLANTARAIGRAWTGGLFAPAPDAGKATRFYRQLVVMPGPLR